MTKAGRPLRFLVLATGGWIALRVVMCWPVPDLVSLPGHPSAAEPTDLYAAIAPPLLAATGRLHWPSIMPDPIHWSPAPHAALLLQKRRRPPDATRIALAMAALLRFGEPQIAAGPPGMTVPPAAPPAPETAPGLGRKSRWSGSAWLVARNGRGRTSGFAGGELGGTQAGVRLAYAFDHSRRLAAVARLAAPLSGHGREAAIGLEWRPPHLPVRLVAEQRVSLDGGRGGPTIGLIAGAGPLPVAAGFRLEAYGQAGAVARNGVEGFADGAVRIAKPIAALGGVKFDLGAGTWGAVQRGARRLDIGPSIGAVAPIGGIALQLSLDWRERIAGNARPGSGPALTIGTDF